MEVKIVEGCVSCGLCVSLCPDVFEMNESGTAEVQKKPDQEEWEKVKEASEGCPAGVIHIQSAETMRQVL
ncbi:MAG: ferredoxin [Clostridiales bacterium]|nr:ferredoxin [Clostridiales bacterium]